MKTSGRLAPLYSMSGLLRATLTSQLLRLSRFVPYVHICGVPILPRGATFDQKPRVYDMRMIVWIFLTEL